MRIHPAADLFPLAEADLPALADDIRRNGQRVPALAIENGAGEPELVDGRRRVRACELAGVEPRVEMVSPDTDVVALVVSLNVHRRNLSAGQRAIAAAEAWDITPQGTRADARAKKLARTFDINHAYVSQARALVERDRDAADAVKAGTATLAEAYEALRARERDRETRTAKLERLRAAHADLCELVDAGNLTLDEALAAGRERDDQARQLRQVTTKTLADLCILGASAPDRAVHDAAHYDPSYDATRAVTPAALRTAAAYCGALADELDRRPA